MQPTTPSDWCTQIRLDTKFYGSLPIDDLAIRPSNRMMAQAGIICNQDRFNPAQQALVNWVKPNVQFVAGAEMHAAVKLKMQEVKAQHKSNFPDDYCEVHSMPVHSWLDLLK